MMEWNEIDYKHEIHRVSLRTRVRYADITGDLRYIIGRVLNVFSTEAANFWLTITR